MRSVASSRATSVASSVINEERCPGLAVNNLSGLVKVTEDRYHEIKDTSTKSEPFKVKLSLQSKKSTTTHLENSLTTDLDHDQLSSALEKLRVISTSSLDPTTEAFQPVRSSSPAPTKAESEISGEGSKPEASEEVSTLDKDFGKESLPDLQTMKKPIVKNTFSSKVKVNVQDFKPKSSKLSPSHSKETPSHSRDQSPGGEDKAIVPHFSSTVLVEDLPGYGQSKFESLTSLVKAVKASKAPPPRPTMPQVFHQIYLF